MRSTGRLTTTGGSLAHQPSLDGLRGVAVIAVLLFHQGFDWASGGFLGVSAFFTLSGFLITGVLLGRRTGDLSHDLRSFWARRARRLLPAAWVTVGGVVLFAAAGVDLGVLERSDAAGALANVANWQLLFDDSSYADLFSASTPLQHFWSLAIEEQVYLLLPLLLLGVMRGWKPSARLGCVVALACCSVAITALVGAGDRSYYGTDTRAAEVLVGVAAGLLVFDVGWRPGPRTRRLVVPVGVAAAAALGIAWSTASVTSSWLTRGGFAAHATATLAVIAASLLPGPVRSVLAARPLEGLGRISYGVYLYHWPVFLWLDADLAGGPWSSFALRTSVTLGLAVASYVWLERPIREGTAPALGRRPSRRVAGVAAFATVVVVLAVPLGTGPERVDELQFLLRDDPAAAAERGAADAAELEARPRGPVPPSPTDEPLRLVVLGDSTALFVGGGLNTSSMFHPEVIGSVQTSTWFACSAIRGSEIRFRVDVPTRGAPACQARETEWPAAIGDASGFDAAVLMLGPHDVADHRFDGGPWLHLGDPALDGRLRGELTDATELVLGQGLPTVWITSPQIEVGRDEIPRPDEPASDDVRMDRYNAILRDVVDDFRSAGRPVALVDLEAHLAASPGGPEDPELRPDGVHLTFGTATIVSETWLAPRIIEALGELLGEAAGGG